MSQTHRVMRVRPFAYQKLYADLVSPSGTVCIAYLTWTSIFGRARFLGGLEVYEADGRRSVIRARRGEIRRTAAGCLAIDIELPDGTACILYNHALGDFPLLDLSGDGNLKWGVRAAGRGSLRGQGNLLFEMEGVGYSDWVSLTRVTRMLGLRSLQWGRIVTEDDAQVFNVLAFRSGHQWQRLIHFRRDQGYTDTPHFSLTADGPRLQIVEQDVRAVQPMILEQVRVLHRGSAFDAARFPGRIERGVMEALTGPNYETRCLSRVRGGRWAVHEHVRFGTDARMRDRDRAREVAA